MTQEEFIQNAMIALISNPKVTTEFNYYKKSHHTDIYEAAMRMSWTKGLDGEEAMYFEDIKGTTAATFPDSVSERECLAVIGEALQAIANKKTIKEQLEDNNGNFERIQN